MRKRQLVPVVLALFLALLYPMFVYALPLNVTQDCGSAPRQGVTDHVGFCTEIGFDVSRSYYFGLLRLPVYRLGVSFDLLNRTFLPVLLVLGGAGAWLLGRSSADGSDEKEYGAYSTDDGYSYTP